MLALTDDFVFAGTQQKLSGSPQDALESYTEVCPSSCILGACSRLLNLASYGGAPFPRPGLPYIKTNTFSRQHFYYLSFFSI